MPETRLEKARKMYQKLLSDGFKVTNLGSEDEFIAALGKPESSSEIYNSLLSAGYGVSNIGTQREFMSTFTKKKSGGSFGDGMSESLLTEPTTVSKKYGIGISIDPLKTPVVNGVVKQPVLPKVTPDISPSPDNSSGFTGRGEVYNKEGMWRWLQDKTDEKSAIHEYDKLSNQPGNVTPTAIQQMAKVNPGGLKEILLRNDIDISPLVSGEIPIETATNISSSINDRYAEGVVSNLQRSSQSQQGDINTFLLSQGFSPERVMSDKKYAGVVASQMDEREKIEIAQANEVQPVWVPGNKVSGGSVPGMGSYTSGGYYNYSKRDEAINAVKRKFSIFKDAVGTSYSRGLALAGEKDLKVLGDAHMQFSDPETYKTLKNAEGSSFQSSTGVVKDWERQHMGLDALMFASGNNGSFTFGEEAKKLLEKKDEIDVNYPEGRLTEIGSKLGAIIYKSQPLSSVWQANSFDQITNAIESLPESDREFLNKVTDKEKLVKVIPWVYRQMWRPEDYKNLFLYRYIPKGGAINAAINSAENSAESISNMVLGAVGWRGQKQRAYENLVDPYKNRMLGQNVYGQELEALEDKSKTGIKLTLDEKKRLNELEGWADPLSGTQKFINGTVDLTIQVLVQALVTRGVGGAASLTGKLVGLGAKIGEGTALVEKATLFTEYAKNTKAVANSIKWAKEGRNMEKIHAGIISYGLSYDQSAKQAATLFGSDESSGWKGWVYATLMGSANALSENIFRDTKVLDAFNGDFAPKAANLIKGLSAKTVSREAFQSELTGILRSSMKVVGYGVVENTKESTEEAVTQIAQHITELVLAPGKFNSDEAFSDIVSTFATTFMYGGPIAWASGIRDSKTGHVGLSTYQYLANNPKIAGDVRLEIQRQFDGGKITTEEYNEKNLVLNTLQQSAEDSDYKDLTALTSKYRTLAANTEHQTYASVLNSRADDNERKAAKYLAMITNGQLLQKEYETNPSSDLKRKMAENESAKKQLLTGEIQVTDGGGLEKTPDPVVEEVPVKPQDTFESLVQDIAGEDDTKKTTGGEGEINEGNKTLLQRLKDNGGMNNLIADDDFSQVTKQSLTASPQVAKNLNDRELTTDVIAQNSKEDIEKALDQAHNDLAKNEGTLPADVLPDHIKMLEEGLGKKEKSEPKVTNETFVPDPQKVSVIMPESESKEQTVSTTKPKEDVGEQNDDDTPVINSVNPTGGVFKDYTPQDRMIAKLGDNITTLDKTDGGKPDDVITVYRGVPNEKDGINAGDFVTTNKQLAKDYAGTGEVVEKQVRKGDLLDDKTEPRGEEYIYRPSAVEDTNKNKTSNEQVGSENTNPATATGEAVRAGENQSQGQENQGGVQQEAGRTIDGTTKVTSSILSEETNRYLDSVRRIIRKTRSLKTAFNKAKTMRGIPAKAYEEFRAMYDPEGKLSMEQAFKKFYDEVKSEKSPKKAKTVSLIVKDKNDEGVYIAYDKNGKRIGRMYRDTSSSINEWRDPDYKSKSAGDATGDVLGYNKNEAYQALLDSSTKDADKSNTDTKPQKDAVKKIDKMLAQAKVVLSKLFPDASFEVHNTESEYEKNGGIPGSRGTTIHEKDGKIKILYNKQYMIEDGVSKTAFHEVIHPIVFSAISHDPDVIIPLWNQLAKEMVGVEGMDQVASHISWYTASKVPVEGITEFLTQVAMGNIDLNNIPEHKRGRVEQIIRDLLKAIGFNVGPDFNMKDFAGSIKQAFDTGEVTGVQNFLKENQVSKATADADMAASMTPYAGERTKLYSTIVNAFSDAVVSGNEKLSKVLFNELKDHLNTRLKRLLPNTDFEIKNQFGMWEGDSEPSFNVVFKDVSDDALYSLAKVADDFDQDAVHILLDDDTPLNYNKQSEASLNIENSNGEMPMMQTVFLFGKKVTPEEWGGMTVAAGIKGSSLAADGKSAVVYNSDAYKSADKAKEGNDEFGNKIKKLISNDEKRRIRTSQEKRVTLRSFKRGGTEENGRTYAWVYGNIHPSEALRKREGNRDLTTWARKALLEPVRKAVERVSSIVPEIGTYIKPKKNSTKYRQLSSVGQAFDRMPLYDHSDQVKKSYSALTEVLKEQYKRIPVKVYPSGKAVINTAKEGVAKKLSDIRNKIEGIKNSKDLSAEEKNNKLWDVNSELQSLVEFEDNNYDDAYTSSRQMMQDVDENNQMVFFTTDGGFGGSDGADYSDHPLLKDSGEKTTPKMVVDSDGNVVEDATGGALTASKPMLYNDVLRVVHDFIAHAASAASFGAKGEERAWASHVASIIADSHFTDEQKMLTIHALTSDTRGQNTWVNFSSDYNRDMRNKLLELRAKYNKSGDDPVFLGKINKALESLPFTEFSSQKVSLLPVESMLGNYEETSESDKWIKERSGGMYVSPQDQGNVTDQSAINNAADKAWEEMRNNDKESVDRMEKEANMAASVKAGQGGAVTSMKINGKDIKVKNVGAEVVNGFYSPIEKRINEFKQDNASAAKWKEIVGKKEEAKWTGVAEWLDTFKPNEQVSKEQILQHMKDNRIQIVEVVKSKDLSDPAQKKIPSNVVGALKGLDYLGFDSPSEALSAIRENPGNWKHEWDAARPEDKEHSDIIDSYIKQGITKFQTYQLAGEKENYKEVLITMPNKEGKNPLHAQRDALSKEYRKAFDSENYELANKIDSQISEITKQLKSENSINTTGEKAKFKSQHFDEPNILAHLRMNTRTDAEGNRILMIEEYQSDFGQSYKKMKDEISDYINRNESKVIEAFKKKGLLEVVCP